MRITLDLQKTVEENAQHYFELAKKARKKAKGAQEALAHTKELLLRERERTQQAIERSAHKKPEKHWYHKYRSSKTRNGHLLIAGQNAAANETLVKHHTDAGDLVFHTDMAGSPFTILKPQGEITQEDLEDAAQLTACYSKAWGKGLASLEVFYVTPEQVTKQAQAGEYLPKGAFMIRGETTYINAPIALGIGVIEREGYIPEVFVASPQSCAINASKHVVIVPGDKKTSDVAKELKKRFGGDLDAFVKAIPAGKSKIRI